MPPVTPTPPPSPVDKPLKAGRSWARMMERANNVSTVAAMLLVVLVLGGIGGYVYFAASKKTAAPTKVQVQTLSPEDIKKLTDVSTSLGDTGQTLNIGAITLFRGKLDVGGDLSVGGRFNANGPVTLSQLNITGTTALSGLNVGSNLTVGGTTNLLKGLTVAQLLSVNGGLNVSGTASVSALNAQSISTQTISIAGPLTIGHLRTQGPTPGVTAGSGVGGGGTVNISGNDTSGTVNINTGNGTAAGILATVTFRAAFTGGVHVLLTPLTGASAAAPVYVTRTAAGFTIRTDSPAPAGSVMAYDYLVTQ